MIAYIESEGGLPAGGYDWNLYLGGQLGATASFPVSGETPSSVLWEDDFSDPASGWSTGSFPSGEVRYEGGELRIRNYTAADLTTYSLPDLRFSDMRKRPITQGIQAMASNFERWPGKTSVVK